MDQIKEREVLRKKQQEEVMKEKKEMLEKIKNIDEKEKNQMEQERSLLAFGSASHALTARLPWFAISNWNR